MNTKIAVTGEAPGPANTASEAERSRPSLLGANPESAKVASYPGFDWLRIVLASIVVLGHEGVQFPGPISGSLAVEVFFALSGWLIGGILLETAPSELPRFFFNRATRIWMPYAAAVVLLYSFAALYEGITPFWAKYLFFDSTFTHQIFTHFPRAAHEMPLGGSGNQFWSISVEEQFYLIAPLIMLLPLGRSLITWFAVAALLLIGSWMGMPVPTPIALGVTGAVLRRNFGDWYLTKTAWLLVLAATSASLIAMFVAESAPLRAVFAIGVVLILAVPGERHRFAVFLGGISYPLYLNHWTGAFVGHGVTRHLLHTSEGTLLTNTLLVAVGYPVSLVTGAAAYWLVDRRVLLRRQDWFTRSRGVACGAAAYMLVAIGLVGGTMIR